MKVSSLSRSLFLLFAFCFLDNLFSSFQFFKTFIFKFPVFSSQKKDDVSVRESWKKKSERARISQRVLFYKRNNTKKAPNFTWKKRVFSFFFFIFSWKKKKKEGEVGSVPAQYSCLSWQNRKSYLQKMSIRRTAKNRNLTHHLYSPHSHVFSTIRIFLFSTFVVYFIPIV